jgi:hypothetical protein
VNDMSDEQAICSVDELREKLSSAKRTWQANQGSTDARRLWRNVLAAELELTRARMAS